MLIVTGATLGGISPGLPTASAVVPLAAQVGAQLLPLTATAMVPPAGAKVKLPLVTVAWTPVEP
ncbi:MAG: hypothetical protein EOP39_18250, partial [Rubrivivax sp.]